MALIKRGNKHYLIRSVRIGDRVTSRYVASGDRAVELDKAYRVFAPQRPDPYDIWAERQDAKERERAALRAKRKAARVRKRAEGLEARVKALADEAKSLAGEMMRATGHHQVRWTWRKKRGISMAEIEANVDELVKTKVFEKMKAMIIEENPKMTPEEWAEREAEIKREIAFKQTPTGLAATVDGWEAYDETRPAGKPSVVQSMVKAFGTDPAREVVELLISKWSNLDLPRELLRRQYARMLAELLGPNPTVIERHLAERVMVCWLDLQVSERLAINLQASLNFTPAELGYYQKTRDRSHRRYVETLKALAIVKQRALPALKLSVAVQDGKSGAAAVATVETTDPGCGVGPRAGESDGNV